MHAGFGTSGFPCWQFWTDQSSAQRDHSDAVGDAPQCAPAAPTHARRRRPDAGLLTISSDEVLCSQDRRPQTRIPEARVCVAPIVPQLANSALQLVAWLRKATSSLLMVSACVRSLLRACVCCWCTAEHHRPRTECPCALDWSGPKIATTGTRSAEARCMGRYLARKAGHGELTQSTR